MMLIRISKNGKTRLYGSRGQYFEVRKKTDDGLSEVLLSTSSYSKAQDKMTEIDKGESDV